MNFNNWSSRAQDFDPNTTLSIDFDSSLLMGKDATGWTRYKLEMTSKEWEECGRKLEELEEDANYTGKSAALKSFVRKMVKRFGA